MAARRFPYEKRTFIFITFLLLSASVLILGFSIVLGVELWWLVLLGAVLIVVIIAYGLTPMLTTHRLDDDSITLYQGIFFKGRIALQNIQGIERIEMGPWRTGVFFQLVRRTLFVTTRRRDLLSIHLRKGQRFGMAFGRLVDTVIFDVKDTDDLIEELKGRGVEFSTPVR